MLASADDAISRDPGRAATPARPIVPRCGSRHGGEVNLAAPGLVCLAAMAAPTLELGTPPLKPHRIPIGIITDPFDESGAERIGDQVPGGCLDVILAAQCPVVERALPDWRFTL